MSVVDAVQEKDLAALRRALAAESPDARLENGLSVLQLAVYLRFSQGVDALLAAGAQPDVWCAAALGDVARLRAAPRLDEPGADGFPPLHLAAHFGRVEAVKAILARGVSPDLVGGAPLRNTALHAAAAASQDESVRVLLAAGANPDLTDANGYHPIHVAAANDAVGIVRALLAKGVASAVRSGEGKTALDYAREREAAGVVALLTGAGPAASR